MSAPIYTGGPAYPGMLPQQDASGAMARDFAFFAGKTLRDDFAGTALQALIIAVNDRGVERRALVESAEKHGRSTTDQLATDAYHFADAMLRAREVQP